MKKTNLTPALIFIVTVFTLQGPAQKRTTNADSKFQAFLNNLDAAQVELQNGRAEPYKALWSHAADITLAGGFGGAVEKGWTKVAARLDWAASNFSNGKSTIEKLVSTQDGRLGYVVQLEHINYVVPETGKNAERDYRVTMIFRLGKDGWRVVHRHADSQLAKEATS